MKRILLLVVFVFVCAFSFAQERLLSMKIVYEVPIMKATVERSPLRDSIVYDYLVDKRFFTVYHLVVGNGENIIL